MKVNINLVCELKFAKLDIFLKFKPGSGSICKYDKLKLWHSCEIHLTMILTCDIFDYDRISNKKNLSKNEVPSSFQIFLSYKNTSFCKV